MKLITRIEETQKKILTVLQNPPEKLLKDAAQLIAEVREENFRLADLLSKIFNSDQFDHLEQDLKQKLIDEIKKRLKDYDTKSARNN